MNQLCTVNTENIQCVKSEQGNKFTSFPHNQIVRKGTGLHKQSTRM